jgi:hypothetical protein
MRLLVRCVAATAALLAALAPTAARAQDTGGDGAVVQAEDQIVVSGSVNVQRGRVVGEVVVFHGSVTVTGVVQGDVVVIDGAITVSGQVSGTVVALNGPIRLAKSAQVGEQVLGSEAVEVADGATIAGGVGDHVAFTLRGTTAALGALLAPVAMTTSVLLLGLILLMLAPRGLDRAGAALLTAPLASCAWGLAVALAIPAVALALVVSILGLPLGLALMFGLGLLWLAGLAMGAHAFGRVLVREPRSLALAWFAGWGIVAVVGFVPFVNVAAWLLGSIAGLGAGTVAAWRARSGRGRHRPGAVSPREDALGMLAPPTAGGPPRS